MSPRAAWRLESLGFTRVYDYAAGKVDWSAFGLPVEGTVTAVPAIRDARRDVPTCRLDEAVAVARERAGERGVCAVVNDEGIVFGKLFGDHFSAAPGTRVHDVMLKGPSTYRPDVPLADVLAQMDERDLDHVLVTTQEGELLGILFRDDARRAHERSRGR
jgi:CBS domain-containing protein